LLKPTFRTLDWHNRFLLNYELGIGNLYYTELRKKLFPLPITHYQKLRSVTLQGKNVGLNFVLAKKTVCTLPWTLGDLHIQQFAGR